MNPVYTAEIRYQDYVIRTNRSNTLWIVVALLLLIPALLMAIYATVAVGIFNADLPAVPLFGAMNGIGDVLYSAGALTLITMNLAHYLVVALVSSGLAVFSVRREQRNGTWDLLVLTRLTAREIAFGKIRASLWVLRRDFFIVTILRVGLVAFALDFIAPLYPEAAFNAGQFLLLAVFVIAWTAFDVVLAVATAIASTLIPNGRSALLPGALIARAFVVFGGVAWMSSILNALYQDPSSPRYAVIGFGGLLVFAIGAAVSLKIAEISAQIAHASPAKISQPISQASPPSQGQGLSNIPNLSQG